MTPPQATRPWFQYRLRTLLIFVTLCAVVCSWLAAEMVTLPWEVSWVKSATSLTLHRPEEVLIGGKLQTFLEGFESDNQGQLGLTCTLAQRTGNIFIGGESYPVQFVRDKFRGDVLIVHRRWKTVEIVRRPWGRDVAW